MVGLELPVLAMEHMYLLTEPMPEVAEFNARTGREMVGVLDLPGEIYTRQERGGVLLGTYEKDCRPWSPKVDAVGLRARAAAAGPGPDRAVAGGGVPAFPGAGEGRDQAGDQRALHLRAGRQPAGRAGAGADELLGGLRGDGGVQPGRRRRAGARELDDGRAIPGTTSSAWTWRGSGSGRRLRYTNAKVRENYARRFSIRFPNEELAAARPQQTTPLYDIMTGERNAVMGVTWGMEVPLWFAPEGEPARGRAVASTARTISAAVGDEVRAVRERRRRHRDRQLRQVCGDRAGGGGVARRAPRQRACRGPGGSRCRRC